MNSSEGKLLEPSLETLACQRSSDSFHHHRLPSDGSNSSRFIRKQEFQTSSYNLGNITRTVDDRFVSPVESEGSSKSHEAVGRHDGHNASDQKDIHGGIQLEADLIHPGNSGTKMVIKSLRPNTRYALHLRAYNSQGTGPASIIVTATTAEDSECPRCSPAITFTCLAIC